MIDGKKHKHTYMTLPIQFCWYVVKEKMTREAQVYLYLKSRCDGKIKIDRTFYVEIAKDLELKAHQTVSSAVKRLVKRNWIGFNPKSKYYFVRGFSEIAKNLGFKRRLVAKFDIDHLVELKAFLISAIIADLIKNQKRKLWKAERLKGSSFQPTKESASFFPMANEALSKILEISLHTAFSYKRLAEKAGFISIKKNGKRLMIPISETLFYKKAFVEHSNKVRVSRVFENQYIIYIQEADTVKCNLILAYGKKIKRLYKGI